MKTAELNARSLVIALWVAVWLPRSLAAGPAAGVDLAVLQKERVLRALSARQPGPPGQYN